MYTVIVLVQENQYAISDSNIGDSVWRERELTTRITTTTKYVSENHKNESTGVHGTVCR